MDSSLIIDYLKTNLGKEGIDYIAHAEGCLYRYHYERNIPAWLVRMKAIAIVIWEFKDVVVCSLVGHRMDYCDGNAENGSFVYGCTRCGYTVRGYM